MAQTWVVRGKGIQFTQAYILCQDLCCAEHARLVFDCRRRWCYDYTFTTTTANTLSNIKENFLNPELYLRTYILLFKMHKKFLTHAFDSIYFLCLHAYLCKDYAKTQINLVKLHGALLLFLSSWSNTISAKAWKRISRENTVTNFRRSREKPQKRHWRTLLLHLISSRHACKSRRRTRRLGTTLKK